MFDPTKELEAALITADFCDFTVKEGNRLSSDSSMLSDPWSISEGNSSPNGSTQFNDSDGNTLIQGGSTTQTEKNEVDNIIGSNYRDLQRRTRDISRRHGEAAIYGLSDSLSQAEFLGDVYYRQDQIVTGIVGNVGWAGRTTRRDTNDYFKFTVGKSGTINLNLTGLEGDIGISLKDSTGTTLAISDRDGTRNESIQKDLSAGDYYARIYSYGGRWNHDESSYRLQISRQADRHEQRLEGFLDDGSVKNAALNAIKGTVNGRPDNWFSRSDFINILDSCRDFGNVDIHEVRDLRQLHNYAEVTGLMHAKTKILGDKVVNGDRSNAWYTGSDSIRGELGNLGANYDADKMGLLIGKHFLGTDRPAITRDDSGNLEGRYRQANGQLFVDGLQADDVSQGSLGTCYFLASLSGTASDKPHLIRNMFSDNRDGTWSVKFTTNGVTDYVTVDGMLPAYNTSTTSNGNFLYANDGGDNGARNWLSSNNELWAALAEKAYAQLNESGRIQQDGTNSYQGIEGGWSRDSTTHITGLRTKYGQAFSIDPWGSDSLVTEQELRSLVTSSRVVTIGSFDDTARGNVKDANGNEILESWNGSSNGATPSTNASDAIQEHAYTITGYEAASSRFTVRNPWDTQSLRLTFDQIRSLGGTISWSIA